MNRSTSSRSVGLVRIADFPGGGGRLAIVLAVLVLAACSDGKSVDMASVRQQVTDGKVEFAVPALKGYLVEHPESGEARYLLGLALLRQRDPKAAEVELRKARELGFPEASVVPPLAEALLSFGKADRLLADFANTKLTDPAAQGDLQSVLAEAHLQKGQVDLAVETAKAALATAPDSVRAALVQVRAALISGKADLALTQVDALNDRTKRGNADVLQARGDVLLYGKQDLDGALAAYVDAIGARPDQVLAHFSRIQVLLFKDDAQGAQQAFQALRKVAPGVLQTRFAEAQVAYVNKEYDKAKSLVQGLLALVPEDVRLLTLAGAVSLRTRELQFGETNLTKATQLAPSLPMPRRLLAQVHLLMGKPAAAMSDLQPLLEIAQPDVTAMTLAAEAQLALGDVKRADTLYQRALAASPGDRDVRLSAALSRLALGDGSGLTELESLAAKETGDAAALAVISARLRRGEFDQALKQVEALVARVPTVASYHDIKGTVLLSRGDRAGATQALQQALKLDPGYFPSAKKLSMVEMAAGNPSATQSILEDFVKKSPRHAEARMALIDWMIFQKRPRNEVAGRLDELIRIDPAFIPARIKLVDLHLSARNPKQAVAAAQDGVTANPGRPELLDALARAQVASSEVQQAQNTLQKLAALSPRSALPWMRMADLQMSQKNTAGAESSLRRALELAPENREIQQRLMALAVTSKRPEKAVGQARELQRTRPKVAAGYIFESEILAKQNDWSGAAKALQAGLSAQAEPSDVLSARLWIALKQGRQDTAAASLTSKFEKLKPEQAIRFFTALGDQLMARGDWGAAEAAYRDVVSRQPGNANALNNIAWLMVKQGKIGASDVSAKAVELAKGRAAILDTHASALAADGKLAAGIAAAETAVKLEPATAGYRLNLARLLLKGKQLQRAREELEKLKAEAGNSEGAAEVARMLREVEAK